MDGTEDDTGYLPSPYGQQGGYDSSRRTKLPVRNPQYTKPVGDRYLNDRYEDDDEEEEVEEIEEEEEEENNNRSNGVRYMGKDLDDNDEDDDDDDDDMEDDDDDMADEDEENDDYSRRTGDVDSERHPKKRKLRSLISSYEFAPRLPPPSIPAASVPKHSSGGRNALTDWTERETFILLDAWADKFIQRGRKSLRSEEWLEVSEKVSELSKIDRTDTQCRNRLDTLKKKYKKDKSTIGSASKWVYFKKLDMLLSPDTRQPQQNGLSCGLDSGEYVFTNPRVYLNRARLDEMRDSPGNSESTDREDDDSDGLPPKKRKVGRRQRHDGSPLSLLADSIHKFSDIYENIEKSRRQQMAELEKMRMNINRDIEMQRRQIMERAQAEIIKIRQGGKDEENFVSAENTST